MIEEEVKERLDKKIEEIKKEMEYKKSEIISAVLLTVMKNISCQTMEDRIIFEVRNVEQ
jgi:hypothetical protein